MPKIKKELIGTWYYDYFLIEYGSNLYQANAIHKTKINNDNSYSTDDIELVRLCSCKTCQSRIQPISNFCKKSRNPDGLDDRCRRCKTNAWNKYKAENSEYVKDYLKNYRDEHKDYAKEYQKEYTLKNKEQRKEYNKKLYHSPTSFDKYSLKLEGFDDIKNIDNILYVKCTYCGDWFAPTLSQVLSRIAAINGTAKSNGTEARFYCHDNCKNECPIFGQVIHEKGFKKATSRETNPILRQLVLERDNYTCQMCMKNKTVLVVGLHCHHIQGATQNPMLSNDPDNCITLCKNCHKIVHSKEGCTYHDLKCNK